ncbi:MAG TPA: AAA family ATPase [bacterium]|nr:AAA family ATPase [bacterium]
MSGRLGSVSDSVIEKETIANAEGIVRCGRLPNDALATAWTSIVLGHGVRERLLAQSLLSLTVRQKLPFEAAPLHGLILLTGVPGTGKTTLARGLANQIAKQLPGTNTTFVEVDPHSLTSSALGRSQQAVAKLFGQTIPELAMDGVAIVLLDELETIAVSRQRLSLDANPVDVHRATDAALAGMDRLARDHRNVLLIATTNFPEALDEAVISRADHIEEIGLPNAAARCQIILDTLKPISTMWKRVHALESQADLLARAAKGLDGRQIRKAIFSAMASDLETAKDPNRLTVTQVESTFQRATRTSKVTRK